MFNYEVLEPNHKTLLVKYIVLVNHFLHKEHKSRKKNMTKTNKENASSMCKALITMLRKESGFTSQIEMLTELSNNLNPTKMQVYE